ncbi:MAG: porin family protein [Bacteroidota bacterium]
MKLNKFVAFPFVIMFLAIPLQAQWEIGGVIDINLASISVKPGSSTEDYSGRLGFGIGAVVDRQLTDQIDLHAEPMFLQKGGKIDASIGTIVFKVHYLEIPLMFRYAFEYNNSLLPYAMAGPSIGLLSSAKSELKDGGEQDEKEATRGFDFGVGVGGGVKLPMGNKTFFAETRYLLGLININTEGGESTVKNRGLQIVGGVTIPID